MKSQKGFTLIELLVVIAIIGILSSVVLASLTTARQKGKDAAVQSQLASMRAQAELFYSTTGINSYGAAATTITTGSAPTSIFDSTAANSLYNLYVATTNAGASSINASSSANAWYVNAYTSDAQYCVDNTGKSTATTSIANSLLNGTAGCK